LINSKFLPAARTRRALAPGARQSRPPRTLSWRAVYAWRVGIVAVLLAAWQWLPQTPLHSAFVFLDPFYISSPDAVARELWGLFTGANSVDPVWPYLAASLEAAIIGLAAGTAIGALAGLLLSNSRNADRVLSPFIVAVNAVPRIALIPVIVIIVGPTRLSSVVTAITVVFFVVFYNAYEGGRKVSPEMLRSARLLGYSSKAIMLRIRLRYVIAWTFAALPNAISFSLLAVVTAEVLTGAEGIGKLIVTALDTISATLTFAVVIILAVVGVVLTAAGTLARSRLLFWWDEDRA
jgi:NitT/TauT family transport system permease protein